MLQSTCPTIGNVTATTICSAHEIVKQVKNLIAHEIYPSAVTLVRSFARASLGRATVALAAALVSDYSAH
jgi:hypothetical protein